MAIDAAHLIAQDAGNLEGASQHRHVPRSDVTEADAGNGVALQLFTWLSPGFPVGSFAYSHGIEFAAGANDVRDLASATAWLAALFDHGGPRNDLIVLSTTFRAAAQGETTAIAEINELCLAMAGSRERLLETAAQGNAFLTAICACWFVPRLGDMTARLSGDIAYPCAVAVAAAAHNLPLRDTLRVFAAATLQNLVSATIRLGVIGQTDGQRVIAALLPQCARLALEARSACLADLGGAAFRSDLAAMKHETQYTRLFRS